MSDRIRVYDGTASVTVTVRPSDLLITWCDNWAGLTDMSLRSPDTVRREFHSGHGDPYAQNEEYFLVP